jgi:hypothetical protein
VWVKRLCQLETTAVLMQFVVVSVCKYYNFRTNGGDGDDADHDNDLLTYQHIFIRIRRMTARKCRMQEQKSEKR